MNIASFHQTLLQSILLGILSIMSCLNITSHAAPIKYPNKPLRLIVTFPAGGTADLLGRLMANQFGELLGQMVIVDNRGGAGGVLASEIAARAAPDGYTLLLSNAASQGVAPSLHPKLSYSPEKDYTHIGLVAVMPQFFVVNKQSNATGLKSFIAEAKRNPGKINFGSAGIGSIGHFSSELFKFKAGIELNHVPYKGTAPASLDLMANRVQAMFQNSPEAGPQIRANNLRLLAVTGEHRARQFPDAPTFVEEGLNGFITYTWYGLSAPKHLNPVILNQLSSSLTQILNNPTVNARLNELGVDTKILSPHEFTEFVRNDVAKFKDIATRAQIKVAQ